MKHLIILALLITLCLTHNVISLTKNNMVTLRGAINSISSANVISELMTKQKEKEINIFLSSNGGSVKYGMQIIDTIKSFQKANITVNCIASTALSMAFVIMQECTNRYVLPSSTLMQHQLSLGYQGSLANMNSYMNYINSLDYNLEERQANRLNMSLLEFKEKVNNDWWLHSTSSITHNVADKIVSVVCDMDMTPIIETFSSWFFGEVTIAYSPCPLASGPLSVKFTMENRVTTPEQQKLQDEQIDKWLIENNFKTSMEPIKYML